MDMYRLIMDFEANYSELKSDLSEILSVNYKFIRDFIPNQFDKTQT